MIVLISKFKYIYIYIIKSNDQYLRRYKIYLNYFEILFKKSTLINDHDNNIFYKYFGKALKIIYELSFLRTEKDH